MPTKSLVSLSFVVLLVPVVAFATNDEARRQRCFETEREFERTTSSFAAPELQRTHDALVQALSARVDAAPGRYVDRERALRERPDGDNSKGYAIYPHQRVGVIEDCGGESVLVAHYRQGFGTRWFEFGYLPRAYLSEAPPNCAELHAWTSATPYAHVPFTEPDLDTTPRVVIAASATVHQAAHVGSRVILKLGYGVPVHVMSDACQGFALVTTEYGFGFIPRPALGSALLDEQALIQKQANSRTLQERAQWAVSRAHFFPRPENLKAASALQNKARAALTAADNWRCESFQGACEVLSTESLDTLKEDPGLGDAPVGPWWILHWNSPVAVVARFVAAYVSSPDECDSCGTGPCQTTLELELEKMGKPASGQDRSYFAASRRPPTSWFRAPGATDCEGAERIARSSPRWVVPNWGNDSGKPARVGPGSCVAGDGGQVFWNQAWLPPELEGTEDEMIHRTFRISNGRVVAVGPLRPVVTDAAGRVLASSADEVLAYRDFDGDGRPEPLTPCPYGRYCTPATRPIRAWEIRP